MKRNLHLNNLRPADRIIIPKSGFGLVQHHAIYLGHDDNGVEWIAENIINKGVQFTPASDFFINAIDITRIEPFEGNEIERKIAVNKALKFAGVDYDLFRFNCEHYANLVQHNQPKSNQVQNIITIGVTALIIGILIRNN